MKKEKIYKSIMTGTSLLVGLGLKSLLTKVWKKQYNEDPPGDKLNKKIDWGKMILWTVLSGLLLRIIKVAVKRSMAVAMKKEELLA